MSLRLRGTCKEISLPNNVTSLSINWKSIKNQTKNDWLPQICTDSYNTEAQYKQGVKAYLGYIGGPANLLQAVGGTVARVVT